LWLVGEHLGVGQARAVVDRDVHILPANPASVDARCVAARAVSLTPPAVDAVARSILDAPELLDVDMDQLPGRSRS
jgi:hypothetical protein